MAIARVKLKGSAARCTSVKRLGLVKRHDFCVTANLQPQSSDAAIAKTGESGQIPLITDQPRDLDFLSLMKPRLVGFDAIRQTANILGPTSVRSDEKGKASQDTNNSPATAGSYSLATHYWILMTQQVE